MGLKTMYNCLSIGTIIHHECIHHYVTVLSVTFFKKKSKFFDISLSQAFMFLSALMVASTYANRNLRTTLKVGEVCASGGVSMVVEDNSKLCEQVR